MEFIHVLTTLVLMAACALLAVSARSTKVHTKHVTSKHSGRDNAPQTDPEIQSWLHQADVSHDAARSRDVRSVTENCVDPDRDLLHERWVSHTTSGPHHSYYMYPAFRQVIEALLNQTVTGDAHPLNGDQECPSTISQIQGKEHIGERSLCPWFTIFNYDSNRYPDQIVEAECSCKEGCVGMDAATTGCEKIYYNIPVLRRSGCQDGVYTYDNGWHAVAVGCVCARKMTSS